MYIIVVGCGKVGYTLVEQLAKEKHNIVVIDEKPARVENVVNDLDAMGVVGNAVNYRTLEEAGINKADLLIAVTGSDEQNLLTCMIAKRSGHCATIARIRNPIYETEREFLIKEFGLAMIINPDKTAANEMSKIFRFPSAVKIDTFARGHVELVQFKIREGSPLIGMSVMQLRNHYHVDILVGMIVRNDQVIIPNGLITFEEDDTIAVFADPSKLLHFCKQIGLETHKISHAMIVGGGKIGYYLAKSLLQSGINTTIVEYDKARCDELDNLLPKATIINGDGTDQKVLLSEGLMNMQGVAALTDMDEENILLSLYAKGEAGVKTITKVNRTSFSQIISTLNLDSVIFPRVLVAERITKFVRSLSNARGSSMETLYKLEDGKAEAMEFVVNSESKLTGKPLMQLKLQKNTLVACIYRKGSVIIPGGSDMIEPGDSVVIIRSGEPIATLDEILAN